MRLGALFGGVQHSQAKIRRQNHGQQTTDQTLSFHHSPTNTGPGSSSGLQRGCGPSGSGRAGWAGRTSRTCRPTRGARIAGATGISGNGRAGGSNTNAGATYTNLCANLCATHPTSVPPTPTVTPVATPSFTWVAPSWVSQGKYGGTIPLTLGTDVNDWDVYKGGHTSGLKPSGPRFNQLVEYNPVNTSEIIGDLATSWEISDDGLTYTFTLYDAEWSDGVPVTASDVVFSLDRIVMPDEQRSRVGGPSGLLRNGELACTR